MPQHPKQIAERHHARSRLPLLVWVWVLAGLGCGADESGTNDVALDGALSDANVAPSVTNMDASTAAVTPDSSSGYSDSAVDVAHDGATGGTEPTGPNPSEPLDAASARPPDASASASDASDGAAASASDGGPKLDAGPRPSNAKFHVFLLLGQSNMAGYPKAQANDKVRNARVRVLGYDDCQATGRRKDVWDTAAPPLHECWNGAIGPGDSFAKTLIGKLPEGDTVGLVPCAISGEKIETFLKAGGSKYSWILQRAKLAAKENGTIEGFLFHQGESNCGDPQWPSKVKTLVTDLRKDLGLGDVPFVAGELVYDGNCSRHNPLVRQLPDVITNAHVVSAQGLALDPADTQWRLHFGHDAQVTLGTRYAQKMIEALAW